MQRITVAISCTFVEGLQHSCAGAYFELLRKDLID